MTGSPAGGVRLRVDDGVGWITLDRPERLNAFAGTMREELAEALEDAGRDEVIRAIVITGAGRAFCAGADVEVMAELLERGDEATFAGLVGAGMRVVRAIGAARQPVVAAVNGVAAGAGASLAAACDLRVFVEHGSIGFTFNRIGLHPDWGATYFLPLLVGRGRAAELVLSGRMVDASEAERIGLAERVLPAARFHADLEEYVLRLAARAPLAVFHARRSLRGGDPRLEEAMRREYAAQIACFASRDVREGIAAFREKRSPVFRGE